MHLPRIRNGCHDVLAMNQLAPALYAPVLADPRRPANTTRFVYLDPAAEEFFVDYDQIARDAAAMLRLEAGRAILTMRSWSHWSANYQRAASFPTTVGIPERALSPFWPQAATTPGGWPAGPGFRGHGTAV